jgi:hypothetical protein
MNPLATTEDTALPYSPSSAIILLWLAISVVIACLGWPGGAGRRVARQVLAVAILAFREGVRLKVLWTVLLLAVLPGALAYFSDADGTHAGRAALILNYCLLAGEILGACLIVLLSALSVAREIENRIMHNFGTKPVPRWAILAGKALGFWTIDLCFLVCVTLLAGVLVRAVPLRPETREPSKLIPSGTWADLHRNTLTTRDYQLADGEAGAGAAYKMIKPNAEYLWRFTVDRGVTTAEPLAIRLLFTSSYTFSAQIERFGIKAVYEGDEKPALEYLDTVPQDRPFLLFVPPPPPGQGGRLLVSVTPRAEGRHPPRIAGTLRLGVPADTFAGNLMKSFLPMALQGWILAVIATSWSGVLSFPVTVALGAILLLGGEMSRQALDLLGTSAERALAMGLEGQDSGVPRAVVGQLRLLLQLLPDFRAAGGPSAFVDGEVVSGWALAHAALTMGVVRALGWALPGIIMFQRREVGR